MNVIEPTYMETVSELTKSKIIDENPEMTREQLNAALDMMEKFQGFGVIAAIILIFSLFFGFLISLVAGLILKKARPE